MNTERKQSFGIGGAGNLRMSLLSVPYLSRGSFYARVVSGYLLFFFSSSVKRISLTLDNSGRPSETIEARQYLEAEAARLNSIGGSTLNANSYDSRGSWIQNLKQKVTGFRRNADAAE